MYNKQQVITELTSGLYPEDQAWMILELAHFGKDEFDEVAAASGFESLGSFWTLKHK